MRKLDNLLISKKTFGYLQDQLALQELLLKQVREALPAPLSPHCSRAIPRGEVLILLVESSAWASRLRYAGRELLRQLQRRRLRFTRVQIRVTLDPRPLPPRTAGRRALPLSAQNAALLQNLAESVDDEGLKTALRRLSRHTGS